MVAAQRLEDEEEEGAAIGLEFGRFKAERSTQRVAFRHECLRKSPLFAERDTNFLEQVIGELEVKLFPAGTEIIKQGTVADCLYFLHCGEVEVVHGPAKTKVANLESGCVFGEMALFGEALRAASVLAVSFCDCRAIHHRVFSAILRKFPKDQAFFMKVAKERETKLLQVTTKKTQRPAALLAPCLAFKLKDAENRLSFRSWASGQAAALTASPGSPRPTEDFDEDDGPRVSRAESDRSCCLESEAAAPPEEVDEPLSPSLLVVRHNSEPARHSRSSESAANSPRPKFYQRASMPEARPRQLPTIACSRPSRLTLVPPDLPPCILRPPGSPTPLGAARPGSRTFDSSDFEQVPAAQGSAEQRPPERDARPFLSTPVPTMSNRARRLMPLAKPELPPCSPRVLPSPTPPEGCASAASQPPSACRAGRFTRACGVQG